MCKQNRPSFCLILKSSHALGSAQCIIIQAALSSYSQLNCKQFECMKYLNVTLLHLEIFCFIKIPNFPTFRYIQFLRRNSFQHGIPTISLYLFSNISIGSFQVLVNTQLIPQLQTCTELVLSAANYTESSCLSNIGCNF